MLMAHRILLGTLVVLCALALVTPAGAVTVNGVDYVLLAKHEILMENSDACPNPPPIPTSLHCMFIQGNVGVSDTDGRLRTGSHNIISNAGGTASATAHNIVLASFADIDICRYDITSGATPASVCGTVVTPLPAGTLPLVVNWQAGSGPLGAVVNDPCVNTATDVTVAAGGTLTLPLGANNGCYRTVTVGAGGTLNLNAGQYKFRSLNLQSGASLTGAGQPTTTVTITNPTITATGVKISDIRLQSRGSANFSVTEYFSIGGSSTLNNVVLYAPSSAIHLHSGISGTTAANNIEAVANFLTVEPINIETVIPPTCGCFEDVTKAGTTLQITGGNNLNQANAFFISPTCDTTGATQVNPIGAVTPTDATLDVSGKTCAAPGCHVIAQFTAGTWCSATQTVLP